MSMYTFLTDALYNRFGIYIHINLNKNEASEFCQKPVKFKEVFTHICSFHWKMINLQLSEIPSITNTHKKKRILKNAQKSSNQLKKNHTILRVGLKYPDELRRNIFTVNIKFNSDIVYHITRDRPYCLC